MNIDEITESARDVIFGLHDFGDTSHHKERLVDKCLYFYLIGRFGSMARQHHVRVYGSSRPKRIDFRFGSSNPVVIELAVRPPTGGQNLDCRQNASELRKLCRVRTTEARLRVLLLIDLYRGPADQARLKGGYDKVNAGPGNFQRNSVRVIYAHKEADFNFLWKP